MKTLRLLTCLSLGAVSRGLAQDAPAGGDVVPLADAASTVSTGMAFVPLTAEQLDQLLGPIALYPDALIALILPAATQPTDIVLAARYVRQSGNDLSQVENRAWDDSVKSLVNYPDVLKWLDENLPWTKQLGENFAEQPAEVMKAVQRLRGRAQANGALATTAQQQVLVEQQVIRIVPAEPDVIYVPYYDPAIVYVDRPVYVSHVRPLITFGVGCRVGSWLAYDFDWHRSTIWVGDRHRRWDGRHDWHRPIVVAPVIAPRQGYTSYRAPRQWTPPPRSTRSTYTSAHSGPQMQGQPQRTPPLRMANSSSYQQTGPVAPVQRQIQHPPEAPRPIVNAPPPRRGNVPSVVNGPQAAPSPSVTTPAPTVTPPSGRARGDGNWRSEPRVRSYPTPSTSIPAAPPLQMNTPPPASYPTVSAPQRDRSYSSHRSAPTVSAPPMHVQNAPQSRGQPAPSVAPAPAPGPAGAPAPAPTPAPDRGDRPGRDRRSVD
ncbi:MAG TPA: DUF3300 domain-containing protein [Opitutaceae bacterium]|nr:DUF3300 domain-containing protein [Opitutaceae bacterium]